MRTIDEVIETLKSADFESKDDALFYLEEMRKRMNEQTVINVASHQTGEMHCHDGVCSIDFDAILKGQDGSAETDS